MKFNLHLTFLFFTKSINKNKNDVISVKIRAYPLPKISNFFIKINKVGIEPDEEVKLPDSVKNVLKVEEKDDTQLQKAIEMAK